MIFEITHSLNYQFSKPVFLEPHTFLLEPRSDGAQNLESFALSILNKPTLQASTLDAFGNKSTRAWFDDKHESLKIKTHAVVRTLRDNPFDYIVHDDSSKLPVKYDASLSTLLKPFLTKKKIDEDVVSFSSDLAKKSFQDTVPFLSNLCTGLHQSIKRIERKDSAQWAPKKTLKKKEGSCRDITLLFMECCRAQGLASRFVTGYFLGDSKTDEKELHAWAEVYVHGGGWRGYDPSAGLAVADQHVVLSSGRNSKETTPVIGSFRGNQVTSSFDYQIVMKEVETAQS